MSAIFGMVLIVCGVTAASAQERPSPPPVPPEAMRINPSEMKEGFDTREQQKEEHRATLAQNIQERIINLTENVQKRFVAATERMSNIIMRLEARIEKLSAQGIDTSAAKAKLEQAKEMNRNAIDTLGKLGSVRDVVTDAAPREAFMVMRMQFATAQGFLRQTHAALRETVSFLKIGTQDIGTVVPTNVPEENQPPTN